MADVPANVLFNCQQYCLKDQTSNQGRQPCSSIDFIPGKRYSTKEYTESKCFLTRPDQNLDRRPLQPQDFPREQDHYHYREVCYSGTAASNDCPNMMYVMERHPGMKLNKHFKVLDVETLEKCEEV